MIGGKLCTGSGTKEDPYVPIEATKVSSTRVAEPMRVSHHEPLKVSHHEVKHVEAPVTHTIKHEEPKVIR